MLGWGSVSSGVTVVGRMVAAVVFKAGEQEGGADEVINPANLLAFERQHFGAMGEVVADGGTEGAQPMG